MTGQAQGIPRVQLIADAGAAQRTVVGLRKMCDAANWLAGEVVSTGLTNKVRLRRLHYSTLHRRFGLAPEKAVDCISMVVDAYKRDAAVRPVFAVVESPAPSTAPTTPTRTAP